MASIVDVARHAGVSVATVSKVMNNYRDVSDKTRAKVRGSIKELNYRPNVVARGLVKKRSWTIGILLHSEFTNPFVAELIEGMVQALKHTGYDLIYLSMQLDDPGYSFVDHCYSRNVEGIIVFGLGKDHPQMKLILEDELPVMFVDTDLTGTRAGYITADNRSGTELAVDHLYKLGHEKIAFVTGGIEYVAGMLRMEGFQQALGRHALACRKEYTVAGYFTREGGYRAAQALLQLADPPTAIMCASDLMAIGVMSAIFDEGLEVPGDISVIGFDDTIYAEVVRPQLTTVNQNVQLMGRTAMEELIAMIANDEYTPQLLCQEVELVVRHTTSKCRMK